MPTDVLTVKRISTPEMQEKCLSVCERSRLLEMSISWRWLVWKILSSRIKVVRFWHTNNRCLIEVVQ